MELYKMVKEVVTTKNIKIECSECGLIFKYPENNIYYPKTCSFDCELKRQHPELSKVRR